jgi:8-oxo-dGTP pyrophosphatase MutT (NUDIX family)
LHSGYRYGYQSVLKARRNRIVQFSSNRRLGFCMSTEAPPPKLAATVVLVRDSADFQGQGLEVLMVRRNAGLAFGASAWVFPGGKAANADADEGWAVQCEGGFTGGKRALRIAAARELFEESGLLLARDANGAFVGAEACEACSDLREQVEQEPERFIDLIRARGWKLALDRLAPFAHWITPIFEPRRFDTHFFLAAAPPEQVARHDGSEAVDHGWVAPTWLLEQRREGKAKLMFPTRLNLEVLAAAGTAAEAERRARARAIVTVEPQVIERDGARWLRIPAEAGYSLTEERLDRVLG